MLKQLNYKAHRNFPTIYPLFTDVIHVIMYASIEKKCFRALMGAWNHQEDVSVALKR